LEIGWIRFLKLRLESSFSFYHQPNYGKKKTQNGAFFSLLCEKTLTGRISSGCSVVAITVIANNALPTWLSARGTNYTRSV
jgi:hypothetical protein